MTITFKVFCNIWVSVTPSDNYFTISTHNLALLHSTLLHSYPVPLMLFNDVPLQPQGHYCHRFCAAIAPFWFSTEHHWTALSPFWLSPDYIIFKFNHIQHCLLFFFCWRTCRLTRMNLSSCPWSTISSPASCWTKLATLTWRLLSQWG